MIIDFHIHCGRDDDGSKTCYEDLQWVMRKHAIDKAVVFSFNHKHLVEKSKEILWESRTNKNLYPFVRFDPNTITKEQLQELMQLDFRGVKLHPRSQKFEPNDPKFSWIFEEIKKPIMIHTRHNPHEPESSPRRIMTLAEQFPEKTFVLGHFCGADLTIFKDLLDFPNIYTETSVNAIHYYIEKVVNEISFDRILYGSDYPYSLPEVELPKILRANIPDKVKQKILYQNAIKILKEKN